MFSRAVLAAEETAGVREAGERPHCPVTRSQRSQVNSKYGNRVLWGPNKSFSLPSTVCGLGNRNLDEHFSAAGCSLLVDCD